MIGNAESTTSRTLGRSPLPRVALGWFGLAVALVAPLQSAAAPKPRTCSESFAIAGAGMPYNRVSHPGDEFCFGIWLESGRTYVFQIDLMILTTDPDPGATGKALDDSAHYVHRSSQSWWNVQNYKRVTCP